MKVAYINTDAGYKKGKGSYAFWINTPDGILIKSGLIDIKVTNSTQAEALCIMYALNHFIEAIRSEIDTLTIYTDSMNVIHFFQQDKEKLKEYELFDKMVFLLSKKYVNTISKLKFKVELKHIKGHDIIISKTSWVNDFLDKECKKLIK